MMVNHHKYVKGPGGRGQGKGTHREGRGEERREEVAEVGEVLEPLVVLLLPEPRVPASERAAARPGRRPLSRQSQ